MLGFIKRNTSGFVNLDALLSLYHCFIRSKLEFCPLVWSPHFDTYINALERVLRKFLKYVYFTKHRTYPEQNYQQCTLLATFSQLTLADTRCYSSILFLYKLIHGTSLLELLQFQVPRLTNYSYHAPL